MTSVRRECPENTLPAVEEQAEGMQTSTGMGRGGKGA